MSNKHVEARHGGAGRGLRHDTFTPRRVKVKIPSWSYRGDSLASIPGFYYPQDFAGEKSNGDKGRETICSESHGTADGASTDKLLLHIFSTQIVDSIRYVDES